MDWEGAAGSISNEDGFVGGAKICNATTGHNRVYLTNPVPFYPAGQSSRPSCPAPYGSCTLTPYCNSQERHHHHASPAGHLVRPPACDLHRVGVAAFGQECECHMNEFQWSSCRLTCWKKGRLADPSLALDWTFLFISPSFLYLPAAASPYGQ
eukprot:919984-Pelagomonas_calceolata.AAC.4